MKHILLTLSLAFSLCSFATVSSGDKISAKKFNESMNHVGDIKQSLLTEAQFQSLQGNCWVKMTGQDVTGSDYASITGKNTLPSTAGRFLRDIGGNAPSLGETQEDLVGPHGHTFGTGAGTTGGGNAADTSSSGAIAITHLSGEGIGIETRPVNLGVNLFVKINHDCN